MKKISIAAIAFLMAFGVGAQTNIAKLHISDMNVNKGEDQLTFNMTVSPRDYKIGRNKIVTLTPMLVSPADTMEMAPVQIAGTQAWYYRVRNGEATQSSLSRAGKSDPVSYSYTMPFGPQFVESQIIIQADTSNLCNCEPPLSGTAPVADLNYRPYEPKISFRYLAPKDSADKIFNLSGRANIIFKVNRTDIDWSYFSNQAELDSIMKSVNAVRDNEYATVDSIMLTGYASPEGPYLNNVRLAKGRTEAVRNYVESHSSFPHSVYYTASVPEDWQGLREWLLNSSIPNKDAMIAFIDDPTVPDATRNDIFRAKFPQEYPYLLQNVYPTLRHTDYRIRYRIRKFYDVEEIAKVFEKNPRLLSLNELYLLAGKYEQGSPEYYHVFMTAAAMYPDSDVANLNAAGCSINDGNLTAARNFLGKVKAGVSSDYAWGVLNAMEGDYAKALDLLKKASAAGYEPATELIPEVEEAMKPRQSVVYY